MLDGVAPATKQKYLLLLVAVVAVATKGVPGDTKHSVHGHPKLSSPLRPSSAISAAS